MYLYVWDMYVCVCVRSTFECGNQTRKRRKIFVKSGRAESGRKSGQFLAGLMEVFEKKLSLLRPRIRPRIRPEIRPDSWPDCDVAAPAAKFDRLFLHLFNLFWLQISSFPFLLQPCTIEKERKTFQYPSFNFYQDLEFSPFDFKSVPYKWSLRRGEALGGVVFKGEALSSNLCLSLRWVVKLRILSWFSSWFISDM